MSVVKYILPTLIKKNLKIFISLILTAALGISLFVAMLNSYTRVLHTFDSFFDEYGFPDVAVMTTDFFYEGNLDAAKQLQGISDVQGRLCVESEARIGEDTFVSMRCHSIKETDFMRYSVIEQLPANEYSETETVFIPMAMEFYFAEYAGFSLGDVFTLNFPNKEYECILVATVTSPEWAVTYRDEYFNFSTDEFGYVLFSYEDILKMTGLPAGIYNQIMVQTDSDASAAEVEKCLLETEWFGAEPYSYTYETSPQKVFTDSCVVPLKALSYFLAVFFFMLAALMLYLFLYQIIWEQKESTGILMALGASGNKIVWIYLGFGVSVSVMAGIFGSIIGCFLTDLVSGLYQDSFVLPYMDNTFSWELAFSASLVMLAIAIISVLLAAIQIFRLEPADAMKKQLSVMPPMTHRKHPAFLGYAQKVCLYNTLRNRRRLVLSMLSTILTVTMIGLALKYVDAGKYAIEHTFEERMLYDCQVFLKNVSTKQEAAAAIADTPGVLKSELFQVAKTNLQAGEKQIFTTLYGIEENSELLQNRDQNGNILQAKNGIILARYTAEELQVSVGDMVTVGEKELEVTGIHEENIILVQYVNFETFSDIAENGTTGAFFKLEEDVTRSELYSALQKKDNFSYLSMNDTMKISVEKRLRNTEAGVYIVIIMAVLIGALIIYNMSLINYKERKRIYAIMLTLGMQEAEIGRACFMELMVQYLLSLMTGNLLAMFFGKALLTMTSTDSIYYTKAFSLSSTVFISICVGAFMTTGHLLAMRQMKKLDIVEELKSKE